MNPILEDSVWLRKGISVLWDNTTLTELLSKGRSISLREFFGLSEQGWPEESTPFINESTLLVTGLDAALDALDSEESENWSKQVMFQRIIDFQAWAEGQYALVFWMGNENRWNEHLDENRYTWRCDGKGRGKEIELGNGIWNGAQLSVRHIENQGKWIGLYLDRIS
jgi:hypothetical protein